MRLNDSDLARWTEEVLVALVRAKNSDGLCLGHEEQRRVLNSAIQATYALEDDLRPGGFMDVKLGDLAAGR